MYRFERPIRKLIPSAEILSRSGWFYPLSRPIDLTVGAAAYQFSISQVKWKSVDKNSLSENYMVYRR